MANAANLDQWVSGVGRDAEYARCLVVYFNRKPSDDDLRRLHDAARIEFTKPAPSAPDGTTNKETQQ